MTPETHQWAQSLDTLHDQAWKRLARGVADRRAPCRHPTLATVDAEGTPQARTVVLRAADPKAARLRVYTDRHADKVDEVQLTPKATVHVWDNVAHLQLRLIASVEVLIGPAVEPVWAQLSDHARQCYGFSPASGSAIDDGLAYAKQPSADSLAVLELTLQHMEVLHLGHRHRRARFSRLDGWSGQWVTP